MSADRLFVPLKTEHYRAFESGEKDIELRGLNSQFNPSTVRTGRPVELRRGYSTDDSLWGEVGRVNWLTQVEGIPESMIQRIRPGATREEFVASVDDLLGKYDRYLAFEVRLGGVE